VTRWGLVLLIAFLGLGLSNLELRQATRYAVWASVLVVGVVGFRMVTA
jgi:hypothetical protein